MFLCDFYVQYIFEVNFILLLIVNYRNFYDLLEFDCYCNKLFTVDKNKTIK